MQKIYISSDSAGFLLKEDIKQKFKEKYNFVDLGCESETSCDYPLYGEKLASSVVLEKESFGIAICGSGIGISIAANKLKGARAANCNSIELARLARQHNGANILSLGARTHFNDSWADIITTFFETPVDLSERHIRRRAQLDSL